MSATETEFEQFLPKRAGCGDGDGDGDGDNNTKRGSIQIIKFNKDENSADDKSDYDPFANRKLNRPTSDTDTLIHLLKSALGSGILSMPFAFKNAGVLNGILMMIMVSAISTNCAYILVKSAHELYKRSKQCQMTFADVTYMAFKRGPKPMQKYASVSKYVVQIGLFIAYFGTCSVYSALIAQNIEQVVEQSFDIDYNIRYYIAALLVPAILLCWVPDLKSLAIVSLLSNILMAVSLTITAYYIYDDFHDLSDVNLIASDFGNWPVFIPIAVFAMNAIGVIMPLENNMKTPQHFIGIAGVLNKAMVAVSMLYGLMGVFGYMTYGSETNSNITYGIPKDLLGNSARLMISTAVLLTFALQFFVCLEIIWDAIKDNFEKNATFYNYVTRTVLVTLAIAIAIAVPNIEPLISLISALCFSVLGLMMPAIIETLVFWHDDFGPADWKTYKNIVIVLFGFVCMIFGAQIAAEGVYNEYFSLADARNLTII